MQVCAQKTILYANEDFKPLLLDLPKDAGISHCMFLPVQSRVKCF